MRKEPFITGNIYHVFNRGVDKRDIITNQKDSERFLLALRIFSGEKAIGSIRDFISLNTPPGTRYLEHFDDIGPEGDPLVSIIEYCLNPNHFHLLLRQEKDGGISEFMKRVQGGYSRYFNDRHKRSGSLFQGKFKSVGIHKEEYFRLLTAYVMWNDYMHTIPTSKKNLIRSSRKEYEKKKFHLVVEKEGKNILSLFGGYQKLSKHALEIISALRKKRKKEDLDKDQLKIFVDL